MRSIRKPYAFALIASLLIASLVTFYYFSYQRAPNVRSVKELVVVTYNAAGTYYVDGKGDLAGLEHDLVNLFVKDLGDDYKVKFIVANKVSDVIPTLQKDKAHLAAANLSITEARAKLVRFGAPYLDVQQHVAYGLDQHNEPKALQDLFGKHIHIPKGSSYAERLKFLHTQNPMLNFQEVENASTDELLDQVNMGFLNYTVADDRVISILQNYHPNIGKGMALGNPEQIAWAFPNNGDEWLYKRSQAFFDRIGKDGTLNNLVDRYHGHTERLNPLDVSKFLSQTRNVLPKFLPLFKGAQELSDIDWRLIAAISYQESHWDQYNTSPTNVRGMMMLTEETADYLGVTDRLDAKQSIFGGARYINILKRQVPENIPEPDRTWMTLAAYNIGFAHMEDARVLAKKMGLNPDSWADIKTTLPMLNKAKYYSTAKFGYANGGAPVIFVESIRTYYDILSRNFPAHTSIFPNFEFKPTSSVIKK
jgi:membrane-bound lytic murein transglycosylase F